MSMPPGNESGNTFAYPAGGDNQPVGAIVQAIAWTKGTGVEDLEPLNDAVDTDALEDLFDGVREEDRRASAEFAPDFPSVSFLYEGCIVTVFPDRVDIEPEFR